MLVSVYIKMRNKLSLRRSPGTPEAAMRAEVSDQERQYEKERIQIHKESKKQLMKNIRNSTVYMLS